jgi:hypothetical protein
VSQIIDEFSDAFMNANEMVNDLLTSALGITTDVDEEGNPFTNKEDLEDHYREECEDLDDVP